MEKTSIRTHIDTFKNNLWVNFIVWCGTFHPDCWLNTKNVMSWHIFCIFNGVSHQHTSHQSKISTVNIRFWRLSPRIKDQRLLWRAAILHKCSVIAHRGSLHKVKSSNSLWRMNLQKNCNLEVCTLDVFKRALYMCVFTVAILPSESS